MFCHIIIFGQIELKAVMKKTECIAKMRDK